MLTLVTGNRPGLNRHHATVMRSNRLKVPIYQADDYNKQVLRVVDSIQRRARFANSLLQYKVERLEAQILRTRRNMQIQAVRKRQRHGTNIVTSDINNNNKNQDNNNKDNKDTQNNKDKDNNNNNNNKTNKDNTNKFNNHDEDTNDK